MSGTMETPGPVVVLAQDARRHIGGAGGHGGELEHPSGKLFESDASGRNLFNRSRYLIDGTSEVSVIHANDGLACSFDAIENLLVLDFEFGVSLCLFAYDLSEGVVLP